MLESIYSKVGDPQMEPEHANKIATPNVKPRKFYIRRNNKVNFTETGRIVIVDLFP